MRISFASGSQAKRGPIISRHFAGLLDTISPNAYEGRDLISNEEMELETEESFVFVFCFGI
jgi:hypothetical protein